MEEEIKTKKRKTMENKKIGEYSEDGWVADVEILEDSSNDEYYNFKLKVIRTKRDSYYFKTPPDGDIFDVSNLKNCGYNCWNLIIEDKYYP